MLFVVLRVLVMTLAPAQRPIHHVKPLTSYPIINWQARNFHHWRVTPRETCPLTGDPGGPCGFEVVQLGVPCGG